MEFPIEVLKDSKNREKLLKVIGYQVCDNCLGRQFGMLGHGMTNSDRGKILRKFAVKSLKLKSKKPETCSLCKNFFSQEITKVAKQISNKLKKIEFETFLVGSIVANELERKQEDLWEKIGIDDVEPIKSEINREVGKLVEKLTKKKFDLKTPDVTILFDMNTGNIRLQVRSLYISGKYQKLARGIPQTKWICSNCKGKGCIECGGEGKLYKNSIQEIIEKPLLVATKSKKSSFHGCIAANTRILLNECTLDIGKLQNCWNGHEVITFDTEKNEIKSSKIADFMEFNAADLGLKIYEITTKETGRKITVTEEHPFFTQKGMIPVRKIKNGWKVAIYPYESLIYQEIKDRIIINENDIINVIKKYVTTSHTWKIIKELRERGLLPLNSKNKNLHVLARIVAFLFGDGTVRLSRKRDVGLEFYGEKRDLNNIALDIKNLGFKTSWKTTVPRKSIVEDFYGKQKIIEGKRRQKVLLCYSKSLWSLLVALGAPVGNKVIKKFRIPDWVKKIEGLSVKKEFLASLLGTEIDTPRLDKRKYNKKSFNTPRFSINKEESLVKNGLEFIEDLNDLLKEFCVYTLKPRLIPYTTRKDRTKTIKICLDFSNNFENLLHLWGKIGFRYANKKDTMARYAYEYLSMKKYVVDIRKDLYKKSLELKKMGLTPVQIHRKFNNSFVSYKDLALWLSPKKHRFQHIKIPNDFPEFTIWKKVAIKNLKNGLTWETVKNINEVNSSKVYDLSTQDSAHTFFANGFLVSNSGREDIDARNLDWRPFVIELVKPEKRKFNLKDLEKKINKSKKVKVQRLAFAKEGKQLIHELKAEKSEKTYLAEVEFKNPIDKKLLKNLKSLTKEPIMQKTPLRVIHRRADILRKRWVKRISWKLVGNKKIQFKIRTESGTYIKELITGDEGRTNPNVSDILKNKVKKINLDVVKIHTKIK